MGVQQVLFGLGGIITFSVTIYYTLQILNNFKKHEKLSASRFFLDDRAPFAFQVIAFIAVIYSLGMLYAALGTLYGISLLNLFATIPAVALFASTLYFLHRIEIITQPDYLDDREQTEE